MDGHLTDRPCRKHSQVPFVGKQETVKNAFHERRMALHLAFGVAAMAEHRIRMKPDNNGEERCDLE